MRPIFCIFLGLIFIANYCGNVYSQPCGPFNNVPQGGDENKANEDAEEYRKSLPPDPGAGCAAGEVSKNVSVIVLGGPKVYLRTVREEQDYDPYCNPGVAYIAEDDYYEYGSLSVTYQWDVTDKGEDCNPCQNVGGKTENEAFEFWNFLYTHEHMCHCDPDLV